MAASLAPFVSNKIYSKLFKLFYKKSELFVTVLKELGGLDTAGMIK